MSLLLDALKKAAEKKAQKDAENTAVDNTEVLTKTQLTNDETVVDETVAMTRTELDATELDATQLEATQIDATHLDNTATDTTIKVDPTQVDATQIDATQVEHSNQKPASETTQELDVSGLDLSSLPSTQSNSTAEESFSSVDDDTHLDATKLDATQIDAAELTATQLDSDPLDRTVTEAKEKIDTTQFDRTQTNKSVQESTQELDIRDLDLSKLAAEENEIIFDSGADETISFIDEEDMVIDNQAEDETVVLTPDDITEFLGDGSRPPPVKQKTASPVPPTATLDISDDTTITNSDSLSLTNIDQDDDDQETSTTETANHNAYKARVAPQDSALSLTERPEESENATLRNIDSTSSSVDIEKLTNDETVTIKDSTFTRTFAPDNYDRTLMKLTDNDVSRIFPGMRSESDSVMTPDYAKKVFISKSKGVKNYYYKVYLGIAVSILLLVIIWGLFEVQSEFDSIDNNLVALKRDPMPGVIKPKKEPEPVNLFSSTPEVDNKAIKIIETADQAKEAIAGEVYSENAVMPSEAEVSTPEQTSSQNDTVVPVQSNVQKPASVNARSSTTKQQPSTQAKTSSLQISSNNRISEKDQLLAEAYAAYEAGDIDNARRQYQQVINLDPENRDALLGRAAIHVYDNQFENAITLYQKILLSNPKDDLAMTSLISVANVDPQTGETEIKRLLNEIPDSPYLHFALGNMFGNQNRWPEAQSQYFKALQYKPNDPNYAYNMAISLEHMDQASSAISYYQRALENKVNGLATFSESVVQQRIEVLSQ